MGEKKKGKIIERGTGKSEGWEKSIGQT